MGRISTRDIQVFVGGALAISGFDDLVWLPSIFFSPFPLVDKIPFLITSIIGFLQLPLGLGILLEKPWAIRRSKIYLRIFLILGVGSVVLALVTPVHDVTSLVPETIRSAALLWLLCLRKPQDEPTADPPI
jgi:hypothetical protein